MNDLGLTVAWTAVQVSLVLMPAVVLHGLASRRSPASGAWVVSMSLGLVAAFNLLSLAPRGWTPTSATVSVARRESVAASGRVEQGRGRGDFVPAGAPAGDPSPFTFARLRAVWERFERATAEPAARCRPWGSSLALAWLTGAGVGLLRLLIGLWAVHLCRRRSRPVDDIDLARLLEEVRASMGCRRRVEIREAPDFTAPATAGWWNAVILLPEDWRSWDRQERRAVFAHELAHVCRDDYATGIVARVSLALHFYHPLVHWLAARLQLEQELAADALGARFAGGKTLYLQSLSRLALRQDGRPPCWPVRAFLPAKETLIRRIAMLREETSSSDQPWSGPRRTLAALLLLAVAAGTSLLHGPAFGDDIKKDDGVKAVTRVPRPLDKERLEPFDLSYVPDDAQGLVAVRPSALFRRSGMARYRVMLNLWIGQEWSKAASTFGFDPAKPGLGPLRVEMFEEAMTLVSIWRTGGKKPNGRIAAGEVLSVRTTEPVDWVTLFRAFKQDPSEIRDGDRVYYKLKNPMLGKDGCFFCPDDRTLVFAPEKRMLQILNRETPSTPAFAKGKDGDRFLRGLVVAAFDNRDGRLAKALKDDEPHDIDVTPLFEHVDLWTFGLDNDDEIVFRAVAACPDAVVSESTSRAAETLLGAARKEFGDLGPGKPPHRDGEEKARRMALDFFTKMRVEREGHLVLMRSTGLGALADFASLVAAGMFN
jgi:beta-lactamase regulating signal transducer with metallopeptidase domain